MKLELENRDGLICFTCNLPLQPGKVHLTYMQSTFQAELLTCPQCGAAYVPEAVATGRMLAVEQTLEDK